jgi:RNA polymerase sigma-70 factor (ECF subfamily)
MDHESENHDTILRCAIMELLPQLRATARFLVRERAEADDLVQETVLRALRATAQFQESTNLKAWLFTIQRNIFYEQARRKRREMAALRGRAPAEEMAQPDQPHATDVADLARLLWQLPPTLREALVLVGAQEFSYDEAAAICGVPVGTMKARVSRARARLAKLAAPENSHAATA